MPDKARRKPVRTPADYLHITLRPEDGARARAQAERFGMTLSAYIGALVRGDAPAPMPASFARLGGCIVEAIAALEQPSPEVPAAIGLLREAQGYGVAFTRELL